MRYLIGTDEAGYGPNLGPLVITATVWQIADDAPHDDLFDLLKRVVATPDNHRGAQDQRVIWGDSKALYSPGQGLGLLEQGLLSALALMDDCPDTWRDLWSQLCPEVIDEFATMPWHADYDSRLPLAADAEAIVGAAPKLREGFAAAGVRLVAIRSRAVFPERWNQLIAEYDNKATALSNVTLGLVSDVLAGLDDGPVSIFGDKHGGRNRYQELLQRHFAEWLVEVHAESAAESRYCWGPPERRVEIRFRPRSECFLPTALASMASKYLRELAMRSFNDYWVRHLPELRPTAGYPQDAKRFKADIQEMQTTLGIADGVLWRVR